MVSAEIEEMENPVVYTIYAGYQESKSILDKIIDMLNSNLDGYTILHSEGYWMGEEEKSLKIDIIGSENDRDKIRNICLEILKIADQDAVVLLYDYIRESELISRSTMKILVIKPKELILKGNRFLGKLFKLK
jgi:hypothetical protein